MLDLHSAFTCRGIAPRANRTGLLVLLSLLLLPSVSRSAPLAVTMNRGLTFGRFVGGAGYSGAVVIDPSGVRSATGALILVNGDPFAPAQFTITGNAGKRYTMTLPATIALSSGGAQMTVSQLTASIPASGVLPAGGAVTFTVGGTLTVQATQGSGNYGGTFAVSVVQN